MEKCNNSILFISAIAALIVGLLLGVPLGWLLFALCIAYCLHLDIINRSTSFACGGPAAGNSQPGLPEKEKTSSDTPLRTPAGGHGRVFRASNVARVLFGPPCIPPLSREAFFQRWFSVLFVRGGLALCLGVPLMLWVGDPLALTNAELLSGRVIAASLAALLLTLCFLIPYVRVMQRRLVGVGFLFSRTLTLLALVFLLTTDYFLHTFFPYADTVYVEIISLVMNIFIYALLLPWPDRVIMNTETILRYGK